MIVGVVRQGGEGSGRVLQAGRQGTGRGPSNLAELQPRNNFPSCLTARLPQVRAPSSRRWPLFPLFPFSLLVVLAVLSRVLPPSRASHFAPCLHGPIGFPASASSFPLSPPLSLPCSLCNPTLPNLASSLSLSPTHTYTHPHPHTLRSLTAWRGGQVHCAAMLRGADEAAPERGDHQPTRQGEPGLLPPPPTT